MLYGTGLNMDTACFETGTDYSSLCSSQDSSGYGYFEDLMHYNWTEGENNGDIALLPQTYSAENSTAGSTTGSLSEEFLTDVSNEDHIFPGLISNDLSEILDVHTHNGYYNNREFDGSSLGNQNVAILNSYRLLDELEDCEKIRKSDDFTKVLERLSTDATASVKRRRQNTLIVDPVVPHKKRHQNVTTINLDHSYCSGKKPLKRKLNLNEYKQRKRHIFKMNPKKKTTMTDISSTATVIEQREKLMKMAQDLLKTVPSSKTDDCNTISEVSIVDDDNCTAVKPMSPRQLRDLSMRMSASIGCNTLDYGTGGDMAILAELKPLLRKAKDRITENSLITSLIDNMPIVSTRLDDVNRPEEFVREDVTVQYVPHNYRIDVETITIGTQTIISHGQRDEDDDDVIYRSSSPKRKWFEDPDYVRAVNERRVVYVGRLDNDTTKHDLRKHFKRFGTILNITIHSKRNSDKYGFLTFTHMEDAIEAVDHGNDGHQHPLYDLGFGGRRIFCRNSYADLDFMPHDDDFYDTYQYQCNSYQQIQGDYYTASNTNRFDALLKKAQEHLRQRHS